MSLKAPIRPGSNELKERLNKQKCVFGTMINSFLSPEVVRILAGAGFDFVFIDMEHSPYTMETIKELCITARLSGIFPIVRVSEGLYHLIVRPLDNGASGVMIPRVDNHEQALNAARAIKYPPLGIRGCTMRDVLYGWRGKPPVKEYLEELNRESFLVIQIESVEALDNLDEILSVQGVDVALVGPNDLSISLGIPGEYDHPRMVEALDLVVEKAKQYQIASGIHFVSMELLKKWMDRGMTFIAFSNEMRMLYNTAKNAVETLVNHASGQSNL